MKRFVWRLQRVLEIKKKEEQAKRVELLEISRQLTRMRYDLFAQKQLRRTLLDRIASEPQPDERLNQQALFLKHCAEQDDQIKTLQCRVEKLEAVQKDKRETMLRLKQFNEGLEKLRRQAKARFMLEQERLEQRESDEMTTGRYARAVLEQAEQTVT